MWTTGQVSVRVMPSRFCTFETTNGQYFVDAGLGPDDHVVGTGDVLGEGDALHLGDGASAALPTSVWIRM